MITLSSAENALKSVYLGVVSEQLNTNSNAFLGKINKTDRQKQSKIIKLLYCILFVTLLFLVCKDNYFRYISKDMVLKFLPGYRK